jgi:hypothetical protein
LLERLPPATVDALRAARMLAAGAYLPQRRALEQVDQLFSARASPMW